MKRALLSVFLGLSLLLVLAGCQCKHEWTDATCSSPQKCIHCNIANGQPLPHSFTNATCQSPKKCTVCGVTEGELLPHTWAAATCLKPKTCTVCSVTDGDTIPHTPVAEWVTKSTSYIYAETERVQTCSSCGEAVNREILDIKKLHDGTLFMISPDDFITRLGNKLDSYSGNVYEALGSSTDNSYACGVIGNGKVACTLLFNKNGDMITKSQRNASGVFTSLFGKCTDDSEAIARVSCALMQAADPALDLDDAKKYATEMLKNNSVSVNGITYVITPYDGEYLIALNIN